MPIYKDDNDDIHTLINKFEALTIEADIYLNDIMTIAKVISLKENADDHYPEDNELEGSNIDFYVDNIIEAVKQLAATEDPQTIQPLLATIQDFEKYPSIVAHSKMALCSVNPNIGFEFLPELLEDGYMDTQTAIEIINKIDLTQNTKTEDPLLRLLENEEDEDLLGEVVKIVGKISLVQAVHPLSELLLSNKLFLNTQLQSEIIRILGNIGSEKAVNPLAILLRNDEILADSELTKLIIQVLGNIGSEKAVKPLAILLCDDEILADSELTKLIIQTLGNIKSLQTSNSLIE